MGHFHLFNANLTFITAHIQLTQYIIQEVHKVRREQTTLAAMDEGQTQSSVFYTLNIRVTQ